MEVEARTMTGEEAIAALKALPTDTWLDVIHMEADSILCQLLESLGYGDVVSAWNDVDPKWYG